MTNTNQNQKVRIEEAREYYNLIKRLYLRKKENRDENEERPLDFYVVRTVDKNGEYSFEFGDELECVLTYANAIAERENKNKELVEKLEKYTKQVLANAEKNFADEGVKHLYYWTLDDLSFIKDKKIKFDIYQIVYDMESRTLRIKNTITDRIVSPAFPKNAREIEDYEHDLCNDILDLIHHFYENVNEVNNIDFDYESFNHEKQIEERLETGYNLFSYTLEDSRKRNIKDFFGYDEEELINE